MSRLTDWLDVTLTMLSGSEKIQLIQRIIPCNLIEGIMCSCFMPVSGCLSVMYSPPPPHPLFHISFLYISFVLFLSFPGISVYEPEHFLEDCKCASEVSYQSAHLRSLVSLPTPKNTQHRYNVTAHDVAATL